VSLDSSELEVVDMEINSLSGEGETLESISEISDYYLNFQYLNSERNNLITDYISDVFIDSTNANPIATVITLLEGEQGLHRKRQLCEFYLMQNDLTSAAAIRNEIVEEFGVDNYVLLLDLKLATGGDFNLHLTNFNESDPTAISSALSGNSISTTKILKQLASDNSDPYVAARAQAYLSLVLDTIYPVVIDKINMLPTTKIGSIDAQSMGSDLLQIYPNPSDGKQITILIDSSLITDDMPISMDIYSVTGAHISRISKMKEVNYLNLDDMASGVYIVKLSSDSETIETRRLIVR
jgi:hypothetical protein